MSRPPERRLVAGLGVSRGVGADEVAESLRAALATAGLGEVDLAGLATVAARAAEPALTATARRLGLPLAAHSPEALAAVPVTHRSARAEAAVGTPSVAEAAARYRGPGREFAPLVVARTVGPRRPARCVVAVADHAAADADGREPGAPGETIDPGHEPYETRSFAAAGRSSEGADADPAGPVRENPHHHGHVHPDHGRAGPGTDGRPPPDPSPTRGPRATRRRGV